MDIRSRQGSSGRLIVRISAGILLETDQHQQALEALDEAITRFKRTGRNPANLAEMMYNRAQLLEELGRDEEALEAYEDLILAFKDN